MSRTAARPRRGRRWWAAAPPSCALLRPSATSPFGGGGAWVVVDLGREGQVDSVSLLGGANLTAPAEATVYVYADLAALTSAAAELDTCDPLQLEAGVLATAACNNLTGRYVALDIATAAPAEVCQLQVAFVDEPASGTSSDTSSSDTSSLSAGAIAGIAVGATVLASAAGWGYSAALQAPAHGGGRGSGQGQR